MKPQSLWKCRGNRKQSKTKKNEFEKWYLHKNINAAILHLVSVMSTQINDSSNYVYDSPAADTIHLVNQKNRCSTSSSIDPDKRAALLDNTNQNLRNIALLEICYLSNTG